TDGRGVFGLAFIGQLLVIDARHLNMDVNTVQQRPADTFLVAHNRGSRAGAFAYRVAVIAARAPMQLTVEIGPAFAASGSRRGFSWKASLGDASYPAGFWEPPVRRAIWALKPSHSDPTGRSNEFPAGDGLVQSGRSPRGTSGAGWHLAGEAKH
ncbi:MAG TPA: hypothetical protein VFV38_53020, partial [Ktedonobacteraceae bacterium]|nr:hypothetical protein [Ktedonobacteraceae bacterium]